MSPANFKDLTGNKFGRLTVIQKHEVKKGRVYWLCRCECGKKTIVPTFRLNKGGSKSCGCLKIELQTKHGYGRRGKRTPEYRAWYAMIQRCSNSNHNNYNLYGGRGIQVCSRWLGSFENFLVDAGHKPSELHTLDRIDVNGNYEPTNCKWSTKSEQNINKRITNKFGTSGVFWEEDRNKYAARIGVNGKSLFLGRFDEMEEAILARKEAEKIYYGKSS